MRRGYLNMINFIKKYEMKGGKRNINEMKRNFDLTANHENKIRLERIKNIYGVNRH